MGGAVLWSQLANGSPGPEIDQYLTSLQQRRSEPEASAPDAYQWSASLSYGFSEFSPVRDEWHYYSASVRHYWRPGSLAFEYLGSRRFGSTGYALALDAYADLWPRAYGNFRYQYSPKAVLFPDDSYRTEIFQGIGKGWELSASYDHMNFGGSNVDMYGVGLGKYIGDWYFRWRPLFVPSAARLSISNRALARYYYAGNGDDYVELNGGFGQGGEFLQGTQIVKTKRSKSFGAASQKYINPRWGFKVSAGYSEENIFPFVEHNIAASISTRW